MKYLHEEHKIKMDVYRLKQQIVKEELLNLQSSYSVKHYNADADRPSSSSPNNTIVLFTPHVPVFFWSSRHNFRDIELKFCILS